LVVAESSELDEATVRSLHSLWHAAFPDFAVEDADHAFGGVHAMLLERRDVVAHASVVPRDLLVGDRSFAAGYVEALATLPGRQGTGLGSRVMTELAQHLRERHTLGALSTAAHVFYRRLGWERWRGPTYVRRSDGTLDRTEDEDDGIMVLRFGPSADLDLTLPICCDDRPGDAW
jgi:aminoglycoside 2'-N-acetyltransferase I